ncbi:hypothetical protein QQF64_013805 [Cirrhinus molitorella]|uniref:Uncharacterized protein n=1 Tax=Cirrhinus molitorella TaxID=172907 RepID=A0ABR3LVG0_9TELE
MKPNQNVLGQLHRAPTFKGKGLGKTRREAPICPKVHSSGGACVQSMGLKMRRKRVQAERMTSYSHLSVKCTPGTMSLNAIKHLVNTN